MLKNLDNVRYHVLGHVIFNQIVAHLPQAPDVLDDIDNGSFFDTDDIMNDAWDVDKAPAEGIESEM